jgi:hypothetical protein
MMYGLLVRRVDRRVPGPEMARGTALPPLLAPRERRDHRPPGADVGATIMPNERGQRAIAFWG